MKILITGAHFTPAQAVIEELKSFKKDITIVYIGRLHTKEGDKTLSVESETLPKLGVKFIPIITGRLQRSFTRYTIPSLIKIPIGFFQSGYYLLKEKPDVVVSFGGYLAVPVVVNAWLLSIPILVHEQTLTSGLANRICTIFADKVAVAFPGRAGEQKGGYIVTGNPIRQDLIKTYSDFKKNQPGELVDKEYTGIVKLSRQHNTPLVFITAGNQGSHAINAVLKDCLESLTEKFCLIVQTGDSKYLDFEELTTAGFKLKYPGHLLLKKWIEAINFAYILSQADIVVSRAGINTLLELAYYGVPNLVIPLPYVAQDEQTKNALFFQLSGMSRVLTQDKLNPVSLTENLLEMTSRLQALKVKAQTAKVLVLPDAAKRLALEILLLAGK